MSSECIIPNSLHRVVLIKPIALTLAKFNKNANRLQNLDNFAHREVNSSVWVVRNRQSSPIAEAIVQLLRPIRKHVHTITFDNETEFGRHQRAARALYADIYFAKPYSSWQRGTNEHTNRLLRQYFPMKTDFGFIEDKLIARVANKINNRPTKRHGFSSPSNLFRQLKSGLNTVAVIL